MKKIFIHIPKNGGVTLRVSSACKEKVLFTSPTDSFLPYAHHERWQNLSSEHRVKYKAFAIVRNPWDRVVSRYFYAKKTIFLEAGTPYYNRTDYVDCSSFEAFLEERHKWVDPKWYTDPLRGWFPAYGHVSGKGGKVRCDILRFENYNEDVQSYLDLPFPPRKHNITGLNHDSYKKLYNKQTIQIVADWYKKDIDHWGFDFDTGAMRNYWNV